MRLFIALPLPAETRRALSAWARNCGSRPALRWTDQLHITLRFLGEVEELRASLVIAALDGVHLRPFPVEFDGLEVLGRAGVLAATARLTPQLAALEIEVRSRVSAFGEKQETRSFRPHVTLARARRGDAVPGLRTFPPLPRLSFPATCFRLYKSELQPEGAVHTILREWQLEA